MQNLVHDEPVVKVNVETGNLDTDLLNFFGNFEMTEEKILRWIDGLHVSADVKSLLYKLSKTTIKAGQYIIKLGRKLIDLVCAVCKQFPETTFRVIFWGIVGTLISSIPIVGATIGPIVTPIAIAHRQGSGLELSYVMECHTADPTPPHRSERKGWRPPETPVAPCRGEHR